MSVADAKESELVGNFSISHFSKFNWAPQEQKSLQQYKVTTLLPSSLDPNWGFIIGNINLPLEQKTRHQSVVTANTRYSKAIEQSQSKKSKPRGKNS